MSIRTVIIADGIFPRNEIPLGYLRNADMRVCCDGSAEDLINAGFIPDAIIGDMDSLGDELKNRFKDRIYIDDEQETNDLTKAVRWCRESGYNDIVILGATGKREDHTLGNISLLTEYAESINVKMVTDNGIFFPFLRSCTVKSFPGQQVSVFSIDPETEITSAGLRYPLTGRKLKNWWEATLNEAMGDHFELRFEDGRLLVYLKFADPFR
ncbi:MAG: thiamine diphosphokinase [Bacteroidales bacterium]|jgi:thiamine pyrophosphokinase|nr:thiamine diphosphokinase [Bacteroidales bacterium]